MPKRPDIAAAFKKTFDDAEKGASNVHPLRNILKDENAPRVLVIPTDQIEPDPNQPRKHFDDEALNELAGSIREKGILQPIIVRKKDDGEGCIIIAGERRWRAAKLAGVKEMPVLVRSAKDAREVSIIENLQRENLNALEEAEALLALKTERGYTDVELARIVGKSRQAINDSLLLTKLPEAIKDECRTSGIWQKSQLLQVLRAGSTEKVADAWEALQTGTATTVRDLRKKTAKAKMGRPAHYRFDHNPKGKPFAVTVTFSKARATHEEVKAALKDALKHVS